MATRSNCSLVIVFAALILTAAWSMTITVPASAARPGTTTIALS